MDFIADRIWEGIHEDSMMVIEHLWIHDGEMFMSVIYLKVQEGIKSIVLDELRDVVSFMDAEPVNFEDEIKQRETTEDVPVEEQPEEQQEVEEGEGHLNESTRKELITGGGR
ncbi:uncharacterized protein J8A68_005530 [[Candida] subhashii]|uniref:Uncharacterized protein n=1 Tax=[Candida] subhashii TaxID=561895 RepID=A0A8J5USX2_9ASCO|nr:uncharacterized protein J8A68_005530 [[Candida] subhashii]KAG7661010.1 hypothetical protein J8A68_005530 [[Candida] subhashii]